MQKIAITTGDPNGIGTEITIKALKQLDIPKDKIAIISNSKILSYYGQLDKDYEIIEIPYVFYVPDMSRYCPGCINHLGLFAQRFSPFRP